MGAFISVIIYGIVVIGAAGANIYAAVEVDKNPKTAKLINGFTAATLIIVAIVLTLLTVFAF